MPRPLKVGLHLPHWTEGLTAGTPRWADIAALARQAEDTGFDSLWVGDDLILKLSRDDLLGMWEGWSVLAGLAAVTTQAEIGTLVVSVNFWNPALLAKMADTVDEISGGRLTLGIGAGGDSGEHRAFGFPWEGRFERLDEALGIIKPLLRDRHVKQRGRHYDVRNAVILPRGPRPEGVPLLVGSLGTGPVMMRVVAKHADIWNVWLAFGDCSPEAALAVSKEADAALERNGRDPATLPKTASIAVRAGQERVLFGPMDLTGGALSGSPEQQAEAFSRYAEAGFSHLQLYSVPMDGRVLEQLARAVEALDRQG